MVDKGIRLKDLQLTDTEKLYLMTRACYLEAIDTLCSFHFQMLDKMFHPSCTMSKLDITNNQAQKLLDLTLKETKGRAMIMSEIVVIQAYDFKEARANTLKDAIVAFLVKNWFLQIDNNWAFSYKFREQIRCILVGD